MFRCNVCGTLSETVNTTQKSLEVCDQCYPDWTERDSSTQKGQRYFKPVQKVECNDCYALQELKLFRNGIDSIMKPSDTVKYYGDMLHIYEEVKDTPVYLIEGLHLLFNEQSLEIEELRKQVTILQQALSDIRSKCSSDSDEFYNIADEALSLANPED